ncbi:B3 domain-containing protein At3g25182 [Arabidopsis lyrata subsp. lyrata]|uniref:B3 domain-containing protein At3g25182 n=1 Tax=Arabidopsis lyrata subsp. lyrata TaxID=81972 RepID=UPI000A29A419|nr:B3 domain-containing protein At3g25182 [Arabidopsis lyrata subsp. lyrata]|eukprot:XP_020887089.1 B3 domain-containing protein At3g25182 [Arabidopsis lyrata subsp. lyrata]
MSSLYHDEVHLTASGKELWSNFYALVDAAVMLYEEEQRRKTVSEEEAESQKRIFCLFPRKIRSSLVKRQQNLNGFFTSTSTSLIDLNQFPTDSETEQNHLQLLSSSCFIPADSETKTLQNPSSESCSSLVLFDYKMAESEKTETKDPLNPNFPCSLSLGLSENTSRKRRAVKERKRTGGFKKAKVAPFPRTARETPEWLVKVMSDMKEAKDAKLIFEKTLFVTDVNPTQNRLSMPFNNLLRNDFLTSVESRIIDKDINNDKKIGVGAILVDQRSEKWGVMLKRWEMKKESGKGSWNYNLICGWNDIVEANGLKDGDNISLWSFRCCGILCFAMEQSSSSLALCLC